MNLRNTSPYHTATLRKIFLTTLRAVQASSSEVDRKWDPIVEVREGRTRLRWVWVEGAKVPTLLIHVPKLSGDEFISLLRQKHSPGEHPNVHGALTSDEIAKIAQHVSQVAFRMNIGTNLEVPIRLALRRAKVPQYVPLRVRKPPKPEEPRNIVNDRYRRVLELESKWKTKLKLAQTKLKKLRLKRRHYEKKLNKESQ